MMKWSELSRLPASPEYWQQLEQRIVASERAKARARERVIWAGLLAAAAAVVLLLVTAPQPESEVHTALLPSDPVAQRMLDAAQPPSIAQLVMNYEAEQ